MQQLTQETINMIVFCHKCHQKVKLPSFIKNVNVEGAITIACDKCKSKIKVKPSSKHEK